MFLATCKRVITYYSYKVCESICRSMKNKTSRGTTQHQLTVICLILLAEHHNSFRFLPPPNGKRKHNRFSYHKLPNNKCAQRRDFQVKVNKLHLNKRRKWNLLEFHWIRKLNYFSINQSFFFLSRFLFLPTEIIPFVEGIQEHSFIVSFFLNHYSLQ